MLSEESLQLWSNVMECCKSIKPLPVESGTDVSPLSLTGNICCSTKPDSRGKKGSFRRKTRKVNQTIHHERMAQK